MAVLPMPYFYYTLLRIGVTIYSFSIVSKIKKQNSTLTYIFIAIGILFNPFFPIYLSKTIWIPIDILVGIFILFSGEKNKNVLNKQKTEIDKIENY